MIFSYGDSPKYVVGDLFDLIPNQQTPPIVVPHVCNDIGKFGAGFVVPLGKKYPEAKLAYLDWHQRRFDSLPSIQSPNYFELGNIQIVDCPALTGRSDPGDGGRPVTQRKAITVINMIGQRSTGKGSDGRPPVRYTALASCLRKVGEYVSHLPQGTQIHAPKFGAGLAGGNWDFIEELIREEWLDKFSVTIYSLE